MATYVPAKRATAYRFTLSLFARSNNQIKTAPTLAAGDVKVSKDNGATANITTLPSEAPASSGILQVDLSATEMTADLVTVIFRDAAGAEWNDVAVHIATAARQIDDLAFPNTSGRGMDVDASGGVEVGSFQAGAITAAAIATGAIDADAIATDAVTEIQAGLATAAALATVDDFLDTEIAAIKAKTDNLPADPADASDIASSFSTVNSTLSTIAGYLDTEVATIVTQTTAASIRSAVGLASANLDTQLADLPTNAELATALGTADDAVLAQIALVKAQTDLLPSDPADASVIAARFDTLDTSVADLPTNAELAAALGTADDAVLAAIAALSIPSAASVADAVWDEAIAGHAGAGSTGEALSSAGSGADPTTITKVDELHKIHGLDVSNPMTVTPTSRVAGTITQVISGDGETTSTVTRSP